MKKVIIIISAVIGALVLFIVIFLAWLGMFSSPKVYEKDMGPYNYAYEEFVGPYGKTGPVFDKVYKVLTDAGIQSTIGIGVYLDDPSTVAADKLRSQCGSVYELTDSAKVKAIQGLSLGSLEKKQFIVVEFPIKNAMSYMVGPMKCYSALTKFAQEKGYAFSQPYEVYDMPNKMTYYIMATGK